jgi:hypothetical protein
MPATSNKKRIWLYVAAPGTALLFMLLSIWIRSTAAKPLLATREDARRTSQTWTSATEKGHFLNVSDQARLRAALEAALPQEPLTQHQKSQAVYSASGLLVSLGIGDWSTFRSIRFPFPPDPANDEFVSALRRFSALAPSSITDPIGDYEDVWRQTFEGRPLWTSVCLGDAASVSILESDSVITNWLEAPTYSEDQLFYIQSHVGVCFPYRDAQREELERSGSLTLLRFSFLADCPAPDGLRPFMFVFFWHDRIGVWVPIQFTHQFVRNPANTVRFF